MAFGYFSAFTKSLTVISPASRPCESTSGSFSILCLASSAAASSVPIPTGAVTSGIGVISSRTVRTAKSSAETKRRSRFVMMPIRVRSAATTGRPDTRYLAHRSSSSARVTSGPTVTGSVTMPDSERFTRSTWWAWPSIERLRCSTPIPPWRAIAMAIRDSVTVSMAADSSGIATEISRVSRDRVCTCEGARWVSPGSSSTSS